MPKVVEEAVRDAATWIRDLTDDWLVVKNEVMCELDNEHRKLFSRRDPKTKEQPDLNEVEGEIVKLWKRLTGVDLVLLPRKQRKPRQWWEPEIETSLVGLKKITASRR